ncbi:MAG: hypothetical protein HKO56_00725 [Bacteroidia bacterium]|nr:hypothetical protein [Bacteroidia bacterium]NNC84506.1 hypothetical protein [Bacteroidia bacterium]NNM15149.1 hypothetical protein [Bacteroidia bacterium]
MSSESIYMFDEKSNICVATRIGDTDISDVHEFINGNVANGAKHNCLKLLFDLTEANLTNSFLEFYVLHKKLTEDTDLTLEHCCAVIFAPNDDTNDMSFFKMVSTNSGQDIFQFFFDLSEGKKWLLAQDLHTKSEIKDNSKAE